MIVDLTPPVITALAAGPLLVLQALLMFSVGFHRGRAAIGVGVGDDLHLERKMRRHGNLAENAGFFLLTLGLFELLGGSRTAVIVFATLFVAARLSHAIGFSSLAGSHVGQEGSKLFIAARAGGAFATGLSSIALGGLLAWLAVQSL